MLKKNCVIFDTNLINENKKVLLEIKEKLIPLSDILIPRMVIEEIQGQKSRAIKEDYSRIKGIIEKNCNYFKYEEKFKLKDVLLTNEKEIEKWFLDYCNNKFLEYEGVTLEEIISRAKNKQPPFINEVGSSDKGFKDSIIWKSILNSKELESYKIVIFATKDQSGFIKYNKELCDEYKKIHNSEIKICSSIESIYKLLNINEDTDDKKEEPKLKIEPTDVHELKKNMNDCVETILYGIYEDQWGNEYREERFIIYNKVTDKEVSLFFESLEDFLIESIFFNYVNIFDLLNKCGIESTDGQVSVDELDRLNKIYESLKSDKKLLDAFVLFFKTKINELYRVKKYNYNDLDIGEDELPF